MRVKLLSAALFLMVGVLGLGLAYTQISQYEKYTTLSRTNRIRLVPIDSHRGRMFDTNGTILVGNRPCFEAAIIPQELKDRADTFTRLGEILDIPVEAISGAMKRDYRAPFIPVVIKEDIDKNTAICLEEESRNLPGAVVNVISRREYRFNEVGSHLFGYLGEIGKGELSKLKNYGYQIKDLVGKSGLEKYYDNYLKGERGGMQLEVNSKGYLIRSLGKRKAVSGKDLHLTIDIRLQSYIEDLFSDKNGACVVMEPQSGAILSMVSKPGFDPNVFLGKENQQALKKLFKKPHRPFVNRAISSFYPAGSVFKPVIAAAGLEKSKISSDTRFYCKGKFNLGRAVFRCWDEDGHGSQDIREGLKNSCNVFFYQLGKLVGVDDISSFSERFGYGSPTGIDLFGEASGLVPNRLWKRRVKKESWYQGDTINLSIGQGYLLVTPIQIVKMMSEITNGGKLVRPYLVKRIEDVDVAFMKSQQIGISKNTLDIIKEGLRKVVEDRYGTGRRCRVEGLRIAGKTGTAQTPRGLSHAWFSGYCPLENSKMAIVVFIEHGGKGGTEASEYAGKIFKKAKEIDLL